MQFKKEHGLGEHESLYFIVTRLVEEAAAPMVQQDITEFESFDPKFIMKSMLAAHKVMRDQVKAGEMELINIPVVTTIGTTKKTLLFTNNLTFPEDVEILCSLFVTGQFKKSMNYSSGMG